VEPVDLANGVDSRRDHIRGTEDAPVTLVEYGDFQCPYCRQAESVVRELLEAFGDDLRLVWRHLPLSHLHPDAQLAAEAAEAAGAQGAFWEMPRLRGARRARTGALICAQCEPQINRSPRPVDGYPRVRFADGLTNVLSHL